MNPAAFAQSQLPQGDFSEMKQTEQTEVIDVVNPYTLLLRDGTIARLSGIDIPHAVGDDIGTWAVTARDILKDMLVGQRVVVYQTADKYEGRVNRMGHALAHLERVDNKSWAQGTLLALGLARVKTSQRNADMAAQMLALEGKARVDKIGIWGDEGYGILTPDDAEAHIGEFVIVRGKIDSVALKKNRIFMNFGKNWRNDFTVTIPPEAKRGFSRQQLDPLGWGGRVVQVRGVLESINGPSMEIDHPQAIEFVEE